MKMLEQLSFLDNWNPNETYDISKLPSLNLTLDVNSSASYNSDNNASTIYHLDKLLEGLGENSSLDLNNLTKTLWPSLQPYNWREQAEKILQQPEYIVMLILCVLALIVNVISIVATCHVKHSLTTHLKLIINLGVSDILIVFSILILILNKIFNTPMPIGLTEPEDRIVNACFFASVNATYIMSFLIALSNLFAMALDHYIAIIMPLQYPRLLSRKRGYVLIGILWFLAALGGFSNFIIGIIGYKKQKLFNFCEYIMYDSYHAEFLIFGVTLLCLFSIIFIYTRIYFEVKKIQRKAQRMPHYTLHNNKAMITTLVIIGTFIVCWLPNCIFQITMIAQIHLNKKVVYKLFDTFLLISKYLHILQLTNCIIDPIIYAVRLKIVKAGYRNFLKNLRTKFYSVRYSLCPNKKFRTRLNAAKQRHRFFTSDIPSDFQIVEPDIRESEFLSVESPNGNSIYKMSDESDVNDNEVLVPMVTIHSNNEEEEEDAISISDTMVTLHDTFECHNSNGNIRETTL